ncbi:MAG: DNA transposition protein [Hoeflea sp.]|uniref:AAA family ATPase n=1 Tax=Hoeflea sp. TaxID=1940281 RepID=UPI000C1212F8|nr:AAA family ATPase [Hoeflea sp.]PHR20412.1 MAG: DNA transposition protein [Hoeflea sp.]
MNDTTSTSPTQSGWSLPAGQPDISGNRPGRSEADLKLWTILVPQVARIGELNGWNKSDVASRIGMAEGTFHGWFSGKYDGRLDNQNEKVERWLASVEEMAGLAATVPVSPGFIHTRTAHEITQTLVFAQMMPDLVTITAAAGTGKTCACRQFAVSRPNVFMVTMSPHTKTVHGMLVELATALSITQHNPAKLVRAVGKRLLNNGGGSLLIVDEAQNLVDSAVDQLRHFVDIYSCGVALVGNEEIYSRFARTTDGPSYAQIRRRIGKRVRLAKPRAEDINALLDAWAVTDPETRKVLTGIGMKDGALGQIDKTLKLATMTAKGAGKQLNAAMIRAAWSNRDVEGM